MEHDILNVIVIEDEEPIREDLALFPWEECGALLVGEAANGREALDLIDEVRPDIIVTDITMPEMDGLTLMEAVRGSKPGLQFVILTCHADFRYAQRALRLGAVDYVVKAGLKESDLKRALDKARAALLADQHSRQSLWRERYWQRTAEVREFMNEGSDASILEELPGRLTALHCIGQRTDAIFVSRYALRSLEEENRGCWFSPGGNRYARIVADDTGKQRMLDLLHGLEAGLHDRLPYLSGEVRFFASVSPPLHNRRDLLDAIASLDAYRDSAFYDEHARVMEGAVRPATDATDAEWDALELAIQTAEHSSAELTRYLQGDFTVWARRARIRPDQLKSVLVSRRESWKRRLDIRGTDERFWTRLSGVANLSNLVALMTSEVDGERKGSDGARPEVRTARKIIKAKYASPLTLEEVADAVGCSPSYLSRVFAQETGRTFRECLTETRVARAMELLDRPGVKVYEVANQVGFPSYRQFSTVFKGLTGLRPKEFQKGARHEA